MREITRKLVGLTTSLALAFGLAACGTAAQPDPTNAEELVARYEANENKDNYHADGKLGLSISLLGMEMPMNGTITLDTVGDDSYYVTEVTGEVFGESVTSKSESYNTREDGVFALYSRTTDENGEGEWTRGETDADSTLSSAMMSSHSRSPVRLYRYAAASCLKSRPRMDPSPMPWTSSSWRFSCLEATRKALIASSV